MKRKTAGQLANKALSDSSADYNLLEIGHAVCDNIEKQLYIAISNYKDIIDEEEFCVVRIIASDPLIKNAKRYKYYCWPYLPSPRPDQTVFLYNKKYDKITKRLWSLPSAARMAQLASTNCFVPKNYQTMQAWSVAFFKGTFWEYVRHDQNIDMLSEHEYFLLHRDELIQAGCKVPESRISEPFDFSKIHIKNVIDTQDTMVNQDGLNCLREA